MAHDPAQALAALFRVFGVDALYTAPGGGSPVACRLAWVTQADRPVSLFEGVGVSTPARLAELRVSEVPLVEEGGTVTVGGTAYAVHAAARADADRLLWRLELAAA